MTGVLAEVGSVFIEQLHQHPTERMLQNFNSTPENDREAGFISVGLLTAVILLGLSMFAVNALVAKFCPGRGLIVTSQLGVTNNMDDTTMHGLPYSSEIRQLYLEASLKSQEFCSMILSPNSKVKPATSSSDVETGDTTTEYICNAKPKILKANETNEKSTQGGKDVDDDACGKFCGKREAGDDEDALPQCLICFETFADGDAVTTHCTDKVYHRHCIMEWLLKHDNCPYCRRPFFTSTSSSNDEMGCNINIPDVASVVMEPTTNNVSASINEISR